MKKLKKDSQISKGKATLTKPWLISFGSLLIATYIKSKPVDSLLLLVEP